MPTEDKLRLTNLDKPFWPKLGITKGDLIDYYRSVDKFILPYLKDRPHSLLRHPDGFAGQSFFQKDIGDMAPDWIKTIKRDIESSGERIDYLVCEDLDSLLYMVQLGCIEISPWNSRVGKLDKPDWLVIDLDPEGVGFEEVIKTARAAKTVFDELKVSAYPKTSGKTGIHIFIPLGAEYTYERVRTAAEVLADLINQRLPEITSLERHPQKRRGKVYIDYLQNSEGQTLA
ncbi:MAG TPA: non-homologous end-joining DNA ligase, partial [Candidatus Saccharimonadales bacterium]|nr:non-homologous end-joining DNA ligase [Candidatus Saccharimonadales bacterium]